MKSILSRIAPVVLVLMLCLSPSSVATPAPSTWCSALASGSAVGDALGDSLTDGGSVADVSRRWTTRLADSMRTDGVPGFQMWTGGAIPGSSTADYLPGARYSNHVEFTVHQPNLIIMAWGTNDWAGGLVTPAVFQAQYQQIIDRIRVLSPGSQLLLVHMPWVYDPAITSAHGSQVPFRDAIKNLAQINGAYYFGAEYLFTGDNHYGEYKSDQVHHTEVGQAFIYSGIRPMLLAACA